MVVQDDNTSKQDSLKPDHEALGELLVPAPPATLISPAVIHTSAPMETRSDDLMIQEDLKPNQTHKQDEDQEQQQHRHHHEQHFDGHGDVDNEQPYGWVVVAAAFFVQAMVIGTVNGYGVYQVFAFYNARILQSCLHSRCRINNRPDPVSRTGTSPTNTTPQAPLSSHGLAH